MIVEITRTLVDPIYEISATYLFDVSFFHSCRYADFARDFEISPDHYVFEPNTVNEILFQTVDHFGSLYEDSDCGYVTYQTNETNFQDLEISLDTDSSHEVAVVVSTNSDLLTEFSFDVEATFTSTYGSDWT